MPPRITIKRASIIIITLVPLFLLFQWTSTASAIQSEAIELQKHVKGVLLSASGSPQSYVVKGSRGVVITGPGKSVDMAVMAAILLRETGCQLPIEYAYLSNEMNEQQLETLRKHNITPRDFLTPEIQSYNWGHEELRLGAPKVAAILSSPFEQVLHLDPDIMPLRDPTYLFTTKTFQKYGALFWPDFRSTSRKNPIWKLTSTPYTFEFEFESGQIVLDKSRSSVLRGLTVAHYFCEHAAFYFHYMWGDKDAFRWGFKMAGSEYFLNRNQLVSVGLVVNSRNQRGNVTLKADGSSLNLPGNGAIDPIYPHLKTNRVKLSFWSGRYCGQSMLQMDFDDSLGSAAFEPTPLFLHANGVKHKHAYYDDIPPFQVSEMYMMPQGQTLTDLEVGDYTWVGSLRGQAECHRLTKYSGVDIVHIDFMKAYQGVNERYMRARRIAMGPSQ
ncbi:hypothetical protein BCR33DRAFT_857510 [Rhizoclosmatium globosum]|uniref:Nucleotide-diphospho-sugar transferase n=1 Tax=Rhizoclosmatium globosum TaxID=329046 RepID=A0A1Y2B5R7_9FUNG|nr:hypothetical protein BCR33DRAFT_857510 [Rhizoclosmatium globosum]|eukprot:ORY29890.1 hypothetical protein BCR33DRAFT_857510 [Rhizoclosmatium globosum]